MNVLVTGAAGFIGSHLVDELLLQGINVRGVDDLSLGSLDNLHAASSRDEFEFVEADVSRPAEAADACSGDFDVAFLLAANSDISQGLSAPQVDLERTFLTTYETLRACAGSVGRVVFASTSAIYGDVDVPISEDHGPLRPVSFYGASKLAAEGFVAAFSSLNAIASVCFRFPNVVGSRMTHGVIFDFVRKLRHDPKRLEVLGDGNQRKPYLHVSDLVAALTTPMPVEPGSTESFNVAGEGSTAVRDIARIVIEEMGLRAVDIEYTGGMGGWPGDVPRFSYLTDKIHSLGWAPRLTSDEAVRRAAAEEIARWT